MSSDFASVVSSDFASALVSVSASAAGAASVLASVFASAAGSSDLGSSDLGSSALTSSAALGARLALAVVAPSLGSSEACLLAASKIALRSAFGGANRRVPSVPGRPLNVCQSPVIFSSAVTCSVGCAPTPSQYCARSRSISMTEGSSVGWYLPISSIARPSRLVRESATTMR